jgi:hypothetical protein
MVRPAQRCAASRHLWLLAPLLAPLPGIQFATRDALSRRLGRRRGPPKQLPDLPAPKALTALTGAGLASSLASRELARWLPMTLFDAK